ncbi:MAG: hypothetical protein ACP5M9_03305 [Candidatus Micrarchaeia archaeon]
MKGIRYFVLSIMVGIMFLGGSFASSIIPPSNIVAMAPITITGTVIPANSQVMLTFNALNYSSHLASNLQNVEFFYSNGTVIPSWLEGNALNEQQTTNLNTASNVIYWLRIASPFFLPTSTSTNTIYLGIAAKSTNLLIIQ